MSTVRRIAKNTLVWFFGDIVGKILSLAFVVYAARYLHAEGYGILSFALAFTGMFGILSDIGFYELFYELIVRRLRGITFCNSVRTAVCAINMMNYFKNS